MSNMSHCRFENTLRDLLDCIEHLDDEELSVYEERARKRLIKACVEVAESQGWVEEGNDDE